MTQVDDAVLAIARGAGDDLVLLSPSDERHFDPFSVVFAFAAMLAGTYLEALVGSFNEEAESLGQRTGERIKVRLAALFRGEETDVDLLALSEEVAANPAAAAQAADAARMRLVDALVENGLPAERALKLAATVQREALSLR